MEKDDLVKESARSWIVAACCCFCNLTFYGVSRLSGIMLVATTHSFHVSRASAAVPFSLSTSIRNLAGVFVGHLGHRFGVGPVVATGCIIASLGSGLCFFAKDMLWLSVCWGGIFGMGFGLCTCLLPLAINQNFAKNLGTASGISYSGSYIGSFIFPPVVVWLLEMFALQGTFLIISGGILNVLVAALLLRDSGNKRKKDIRKSCDDTLCTDSETHQKSATAQPYIIDAPEMWKQNIQRSYITSCDDCFEDNRYKQEFSHRISSVNNSYFIPDSTCVERVLGNESTFDKVFCSHNFLYSDFHHHSISPNLFRTFECTTPWNTEYDKAAAPQNIPYTFHSASDISLTSDIDCVHSIKCSNCCLINDKNSINNSAKEVAFVPRLCLKRPSNRSLFRGNLKAKHKLKLMKIKTILFTSFLKHRFPHLKEFEHVGNVKLTSFRHLSPFTCINTCSISTPNKCYHLSSPQNIISRRSTISDINNLYSNSVSSLQHAPECRGRLYSLPMIGTNDRQQIPFVNDSLLQSTNFHSLPENSHNQRIKTSSCDASVNQKQDHSCLFHSTNDICDVFSCNKNVIVDECASSIFKNEESLSPRNIFSLRPESLILNKTEFKAQKRKVSLSGQSKSGDSKSCFLDWLCMFREPMFVIIGFTMSIQTFIVVSVVTTIEDYARDIGIPENRTHYALMALSIANLVGTLTLGSITDRGFISRHRFMFLCFFGMSVSLVAVSLFAVSLHSLLLLIVTYGLLESGVIITFPLLIKQFVKGQRRQAVAIASSNVLSVPTVMLVPMLIGHFRDNIGSYVGLFHLLGATSLTCSVLWLVAPSIVEGRKLKKIALKLNNEKC